ncbi:MAG: DUF952 domain-containing protein [Acaryochloridaceae cyanobacterium RL_2_7]|nr:DUF952 domain-containing protein [Acaryochloridaceae cyanobacterium RL_2_7]
MGHLFHITEQESWEKAQAEGVYRAPSLQAEGFIHLSGEHQVIETANRFYQGQSDLVLLEIEAACLTSKLQYEAVLNHGVFPHLYGELNLDAVTAVRTLNTKADGSFTGWS